MNEESNVKEENESSEKNGEEQKVELPSISWTTPNLNGKETFDIPEKTIVHELNYSNKGVTAGFSADTSFKDDKIDISDVTANVGVETTIGETNLQINGNVAVDDSGNVTSGVNVGVQKTFDNQIELNTSAQVEFAEDTTYSADVNLATNGGNIRTKTTLHTDNNDSSATVLLNPNNLGGLEDDYQTRKEALQNSDDTFNLKTKIGYSNVLKSFYDELSLMWKAGKETFLTATYNYSEKNIGLSAIGDFKKFYNQYSFSKLTEEDGTKVTTHRVESMLKGGKNQYTAETTIQNSRPLEGESTLESHTTAGASLNRNEYGAFQEGFNSELKGGIFTKNGKYDGYSATVDLAYNVYRTGENKNDFLLGLEGGVEQRKDIKDYSIGTCNAFRFNDERTTIEQAFVFSNSNKSGRFMRTYNARAGILQQLGKNYGDASIYTQMGFTHENASGYHCNTIYVSNSASVKATDKLTLNFENLWQNHGGWEGNIGFTFSF